MRCFLSNKGLSNEVGIHVFCYDPKEEMLVSSFFSDLIQGENQPFRLKECDLYRIFLQICEEKRILKSIPAMEKKERLGVSAEAAAKGNFTGRVCGTNAI